MPTKKPARKTGGKTTSKKSTRKKTTKKKATRKKVVKKRISKKNTPKKPVSKKKKTKPKEKKENQNQKEKEYIAINEEDREEEAKSKMTWAIVGAITLLLVGFWFWTMKQSIVKNQSQNNNIENMASEVDQTVDKLKDIFKNTGQIVDHVNQDISKKQRLENLKNQILEEIEKNATSESWPTHTSEPMGLEMKYPPGWSKQEATNILTLLSYQSTTTPEIYSKLSIHKNENTQNLDPEEWIRIQSKYQIKDIAKYTTTTISGLPARRYDLQTRNVIVMKNNLLYDITVESETNPELYQNTIEKILSTIKFIK